MNVKSKILIVEDTVMVALHIRKSLELAGYDVVNNVSSGEEAIAYLKEEILPDIILMDIMLEGELDGIETTSLINKQFNIPIIYLTALSDHQTIERAKHTNPYGFVMKPFKELELHTNISMALHKSSIENKLRQSEDRFLSTVQSIEDMLVTLNTEGNITFINQSSAKALGILNNKEPYNKKFDEIFNFRLIDSVLAGEEKFRLFENYFYGNPIPERLQLINSLKENITVGDFSFSVISNQIGVADGYVIVFRNLQSKLKEEESLHEMEVRNLSFLIEGQELERARVSRELHDGLGQMLSALKMNFSGLKKYMPSNNIVRLNHFIDDTIGEVKRISNDLMPLNLNELDLSSCLESLCNGISSDKPKIVYYGDVSEFRTDSIVKINLFRIAQEAINNSLKYADAEIINVQLTKEGNFLFLSIEDDGKGFNKSNLYNKVRDTGHGLRNMEDRAKIVKGIIEIDSKKDFGTLVTVQLPIN